MALTMALTIPPQALPFLAQAAYALVFAETIFSTSPAATLPRVASAALLAALTHLTELTTVAATENRSTKAFVLPVLWVVWLHSVDLLLVSRAGVVDVLTPSEIVTKKRPWVGRRVRLGLGLNWNWSRKGTRWEMVQLKRVREHKADSKSMFLLKTGAVIALQYLCMDVISSAPMPPREIMEQRRESFLTRLDEVTIEELVSTVTLCLASAIAGGMYILLTYNVFTFVAVLLAGASPGDFPPFMGSPLEAYSVRRFWEVMWHQGLRQPLRQISNAIITPLDRITGADPKSHTSRLARMVVAFVISAGIHQRSETLCGVPAGEHAAFWFFSIQPLGIAIETAVAAAYRRYSPVRLGAGLERVVGYAWAAVFLLWQAPSWSFPIMRNVVPERDRTIPWKVVGQYIDFPQP